MADIVVPSAYDMEVETFKQHMNLRHIEADGLLEFTKHDKSEPVIAFATACHDYWHRTNPDKYDHEHLEEL